MYASAYAMIFSFISCSLVTSNKGCLIITSINFFLCSNISFCSFHEQSKNIAKLMTKADLADKVYEKVGLARKEAVEMIETLFSSMKSILSEGESIKITGFGTFLVRKKSSRRGRNPKTGEEMEITARKVITFKPSLEFKEVVEKA